MAAAHRIIYVCSNHKLPSKNIMDMALVDPDADKPEYSVFKDLKGTDPFFPSRVIPVDISPHSLRCELVICLERIDLKTMPTAKRTPYIPYSRLLNQHVYHGTYSHNTPDGTRPGRAGRGGFGFRGRVRGRGMASRDSLYPRPLRPNLYPAPKGRGGFVEPPMRRPFGPHLGRMRPHYQIESYPRPRPPEFDNGLHRYSEFRRDVEEAIDSSYPVRSPASRRLAMANAMLEKGLRLAEEAMAEGAERPRQRPLLGPEEDEFIRPPRLIRRRQLMVDEDEMPPPLIRRRPPPMAVEDEFDEAWDNGYATAPPLVRRRLPPPVEEEDFRMPQPVFGRRAPPPMEEEYDDYAMPPVTMRRGRGFAGAAAWRPPPLPPPQPKPEEKWASTWDGDDYVIVTPPEARPPPPVPRGRGFGYMRGARGTTHAMSGSRGGSYTLMRGTRGANHVMRGTHGANHVMRGGRGGSGGVWRH